MKNLIEVLREISNSGINEKCILILNEKRTELGDFIETHDKKYLRKLEVIEISHNDLFMQYEIKVKEIKNECK